jgi:hypothetical protein
LSNVAAVGHQCGVPKRRGSSSSRGEWWRRVSLEEEHRGDWKLNYERRARRTYQVPIDLVGINQEAGKKLGGVDEKGCLNVENGRVRIDLQNKI